MKLTNILLETFDQPYSWVSTVDKPHIKMYEFTTSDGIRYEVYIGIDEPQTWEVAFTANVNKRIKQDKTGTGDSIRVFATVMDIVKSFVKTTYVKMVSFKASKLEGTGRSKLYTALVNRYAPQLGFDVVSIKSGTENVIYTLKNKKKPKLKLKEVFDQPYSWNRTKNGPDEKAYRFKTEAGVIYDVLMYERKSNEWLVEFTAKVGSKTTQDKTGTGDSIRVFSTVVDIIKHFVSEQYIGTITFAADKLDGDSRARLYATLAKSIAPKIGFKVTLAGGNYSTALFKLKNTKRPKGRRLNEVFDKPYSWTKVVSTVHRAEYSFTTADGLKYGVEFYQITDPHDKERNGRVILTFWAMRKTKPTPIGGGGQDYAEFGQTGTGDAIRVFATVMAIVKQYTRERWVKAIEFSADDVERNRVRLYKKLIGRYAGDMGFRLVKVNDTGIGIEFLLKNTRPKKK